MLQIIVEVQENGHQNEKAVLPLRLLKLSTIMQDETQFKELFFIAAIIIKSVKFYLQIPKYSIECHDRFYIYWTNNYSACRRTKHIDIF